MCVCVQLGLEVSMGGRGNCCASPRSTIQILICSLPQETATISLPPQQLELDSQQQYSSDNSSTCSRLSVITDSHGWRQMPVKGLGRKADYWLTTKQSKSIKKRRRKKSSVVWFERNCRGDIQPSGSPLQRWDRGLLFLISLWSDGAQQSIAGSGKIQAPFHRMPMLITPNNRYADGASLEIRRCP